ncbi:rhodanese-like domain-containing protein [bacterium]|nr:rhodanese-like domain-containing protein [bacterium]
MGSNGGLTNINQTQFDSLKTQENVVVLDVRTPGEVQQGYIEGADLFIDINGSNFEQEIAALDTNKTYLVYCRSGARSSRAGNYMVEQGFNSVYNLSGGIMNYSGTIRR